MKIFAALSSLLEEAPSPPPRAQPPTARAAAKASGGDVEPLATLDGWHLGYAAETKADRGEERSRVEGD